MSSRPTIAAPYRTLAEWAKDRADMRIVCACGRTINLPAERILDRFKGDGEVASKVIRLRCQSCRRRGHASVSSIPALRR